MSNPLFRSVKSCVVLSLLGAWAVLAQPAGAQQQTLTGWFTITVADYPTESGLASEITYGLTDDQGQYHELLIDIDLMKPLGGPVALNRKLVTVVGEWEQDGADATEKFRVSSIRLAVSLIRGRCFSQASPDGTSNLCTNFPWRRVGPGSQCSLEVTHSMPLWRRNRCHPLSRQPL